MNALEESERITLVEGLALLKRHTLAEQAKVKLKQALIQGVLKEQPRFAFEYDEADIDWVKGAVKIPRKPERFCPTFLRVDFNRYFFPEPKQGFSPFIIKALVDVITGGAGNDSTPPIGVYRSGPKIEQFFLDCGLDMRVGTTSRVPATTEFLRQVARGENGDAVLTKVLLRVADPRDYFGEPEKTQAVVEHLNRALEADGFAVTIVGGKPQLVTRQASGAIVAAIIEKTTLLDFDTVQRDIARAQQGLTDDPEDTVTAACSLIESVCRSILIELDLPLPAKKDIDGLIRAVQEPLGLSPGKTDLPPEIEADVRQVLSGLTSVAKGIGALRTHAGEAHGREKGFRRLDARIARLSVNAAGSLALFLIETWEHRQKRALPSREVP